MLLAVNKDSLLGCNYEAAAGLLKKTEGMVVLTVCNPNKKDDANKKDTTDSTSLGASSKGPSRPITPKPEPSPAKVIPTDPTTCEIKTNENTTIELKLENKPIGIHVIGGCDTIVNVSKTRVYNVDPNRK